MGSSKNINTFFTLINYMGISNGSSVIINALVQLLHNDRITILQILNAQLTGISPPLFYYLSGWVEKMAF